MLSVAIVMSDWKESTTYCPKLDAVRLTSDTPKTKKKGHQRHPNHFPLENGSGVAGAHKNRLRFSKKNSKKKNTNKFNFEKTGFWCPKLHVLTVLIIFLHGATGPYLSDYLGTD